MISNLPIGSERINEFCRKWNIQELALFGSALSTHFGPTSDVDLLVTFSKSADWSLFDRSRMTEELSSLLGRRVDIVEAVALTNPFRRREILSTRQVIYGT